MPQLAFVTLDVFTTTRFAGNPLAIIRIPKGRDVSTEQMQTMAREFNLSETVFIHEDSTDRDGLLEWRVRIFMIEAELPFAGHPTIGTACYALGTLAKGATKGRLICNAGPIELDYQGSVARASIPHDVHIHQQSSFTEEQVYRLQPALKKAGVPKAIDVVSPVKGMNFICVELPTLHALSAVETSGVKPQPTLDDGWDTGFAGSYFYVVESEEASVTKVRTRMIEGTLEDPATGSAACGLGALLALKHRNQSMHYEITQGVEMGRHSDIGVTVTLQSSRSAVEKVELSGSAVKVMEGMIEY